VLVWASVMVGLVDMVEGQNGTTLQFRNQTSPRFCSLDLNSDCYCCHWVEYSQNLAMRAIIPIVLTAVIWIACTIGLCKFCWATSLQDRTLPEKEYKPKCSVFLKLALMFIPFAILSAGILLILIAHFHLNTTFDSADAELNTQYQNVLSIENKIMSLVIPNGTTVDYSAMNKGLVDLKGNIDFFQMSFNGVTIGRQVVVWFASGLAVMIGLLSCVYVHVNNGTLLEWWSALAIFMILGSCVTTLVLVFLNEMLYDGCNELYYSNGLLALWQSLLQNNINKLIATSIIPAIQDSTTSACSSANDMCNTALCCSAMCGACDTNNLPTFLGRIISDGVIQRNVTECASSCLSTTLKSSSGNIVGRTTVISTLQDLIALLNELVAPFYDPQLNGQLVPIICQNSTHINHIWIGCSCFVVGAVLCAVFSFFLRGVKEGGDTL